jgi:hypothetical protein
VLNEKKRKRKKRLIKTEYHMYNAANSHIHNMEAFEDLLSGFAK